MTLKNLASIGEILICPPTRMIVARHNVLGLKVMTSIVVEIIGCSLSLLVNEVCESANIFLKLKIDAHLSIDYSFMRSTYKKKNTKEKNEVY